MLTKRYLASVKNVPEIFQQITKGTAPANFNIDHLKGIGFNSSNDRAIIPLLKDLGFLTEAGVPTQRYHDYRAGPPQNRAIMGQALMDAYQDIFHINANPTEADREAIKGKFKSAHNTTDRISEQQAVTFYSLLKLADLAGARAHIGTHKKIDDIKTTDGKGGDASKAGQGGVAVSLGYKVEVYLPATKEIEVYNAIFKSLRENILVS